MATLEDKPDKLEDGPCMMLAHSVFVILIAWAALVTVWRLM